MLGKMLGMLDYLLFILITLALIHAFIFHFSFPVCMLVHNVIPDNFTTDTVIPIPKGKNTNLTALAFILFRYVIVLNRVIFL
jgi:hypothetical protein